MEKVIKQLLDRIETANMNRQEAVWNKEKFSEGYWMGASLALQDAVQLLKEFKN